MKPSRSSLLPRRKVQILIPLPLLGPYEYLVPNGLNLELGDFVLVPLGSRTVLGIVWPSDVQEESDGRRFKEVLELVDLPPLPKGLISLINWVASYTLAPLGAVLRMAMPPAYASWEERKQKVYRVTGKIPERYTQSRQRVLDTMKSGKCFSLSEITSAASVSAGVVRNLANGGILEVLLISNSESYSYPNLDKPKPKLTDEQKSATKILWEIAEENIFSVTVLDGVTGSGKTEVYFEAILKTLKIGRQCLVMLPEIALTSQWLDRFFERFGVMPVVWHSNISQRERQRAWRAVASGAVGVVVGARSSLFLPFPNLGSIIVDEEHDFSYKQQDGVLYNARDMAIVRAKIEKIPVILVSATPSLETEINVRNGRYKQLKLSSRYGEAKLPHISLIDLRNNAPSAGSWISPPLFEAITNCLENSEQVLLFLNRRGYAPLTLCRSCGHRVECPNCSSWLVAHKTTKKLLCHHCGFAKVLRDACPECKAEGSFVAVGPGVERISEEISELFPKAKQSILSSDILTGGKQTTIALNEITEKKVDIVVGTQVVSKGHHFPYLTLVGVIDADLGLAGGDLRAAERTFQLLSQVTGRAGRERRAGKAILQTYLPDHPVMMAIATGKRDEFVTNELAARAQHGMPPFGRLVAIIVSSQREQEARRTAQNLAEHAPREDTVRILGPAPAPLSLLRGRYRQRLLLKADHRTSVQKLLRNWQKQVRVPKSVRVQIDVDPYSFL